MNDFAERLLLWHQNVNQRSLHWKNEKDPYKVWLSEIILQQTKAQQATPYYLRFIEKYPDIHSLADAPEEDVFRLWQGLGYYNRCKNMLATAKIIVCEMNGKFPDTYEGLLKLKGVGSYTAAAIASFAFDLPHAVVDGNVFRVLSRVFGIETPFDTTEGKKQFTELANSLIDEKHNSAYNQAIMDLGATVCKPQIPVCGECLFQFTCVALKSDIISELPVKSKRTKVITRYFNYLVLVANNKMLLRKRPGGDIWQNLYEPFLIETSIPVAQEELQLTIDFNNILRRFKQKEPIRIKQKLTHQLIQSEFYLFELQGDDDLTILGYNWYQISEIHKIAFPKSVLSFFRETAIL